MESGLLSRPAQPRGAAIAGCFPALCCCIPCHPRHWAPPSLGCSGLLLCGSGGLLCHPVYRVWLRGEGDRSGLVPERQILQDSSQHFGAASPCQAASRLGLACRDQGSCLVKTVLAPCRPASGVRPAWYGQGISLGAAQLFWSPISRALVRLKKVGHPWPRQLPMAP